MRARTYRSFGAPLALLALGACDGNPYDAWEAWQGDPHGLSRVQIEQTMRDHGAALKTCWKANGPHGELKLRVAVKTSADGHVESAVADGKDAAARACVEKQIKGWTFAKTEASTKFSLPVNFTR